jgi:hypothetical protein
VEQQGRTSEDLHALWSDYDATCDAGHKQADDLDELIREFNEAPGLFKAM